jgi:hypothetical protein
MQFLFAILRPSAATAASRPWQRLSDRAAVDTTRFVGFSAFAAFGRHGRFAALAWLDGFGVEAFLCEFSVWRRFCASLRYGDVFVRVYGMEAFLCEFTV